MNVRLGVAEGYTQAQDPFVIRGHHISYLTSLVAPMGISPEKMAAELREDSIRDRGELTASTIDWGVIENRSKRDPRYWSSYAYDLIGESDAQGDQFERSLTNTFRTFLELPDDADVLLTARGIDRVCESCTFQKHCNAPGETEVDAKYLDVFEDVLTYANTKDQALDAEATRLDTGDIHTTAKAVRRVLAHFAIAKAWKVNLISDAMERRETYGNVFAGSDDSDIERYYASYGHEIN